MGKKKDVNWELVERMMEAQCTMKEIAGACKMHVDTLNERFQEKYGDNYTEVTYRFSQYGLGVLKLSQYRKALNNKSPGNVQMLIYLGKILLGQKEPGDEIKEEIIDLKTQLKTYRQDLDANRNPVKETK